MRSRKDATAAPQTKQILKDLRSKKDPKGGAAKPGVVINSDALDSGC